MLITWLIVQILTDLLVDTSDLYGSLEMQIMQAILINVDFY